MINDKFVDSTPALSISIKKKVTVQLTCATFATFASALFQELIYSIERKMPRVIGNILPNGGIDGKAIDSKELSKLPITLFLLLPYYISIIRYEYKQFKVPFLGGGAGGGGG